MSKDIILIGMMGCGKSTVAKTLSQAMKRPFLDLDLIIEERLGKKINDIFAQMGEEGFRKIEAEVFEKELQGGRIIATGGGIVTNPVNQKTAKRGIVVFINRPISEIEKDIVKETRPMLKEKGVREIYEKRYKLYKAFADIEVINDGSIEELTQKIIKEVESYENYDN